MRALLRLVVPVLVPILVVVVACRVVPEPRPEEVRITPGLHHLGDDTVADWTGHEAPLGARLDLPFTAAAPDGPAVLQITQEDVNGRWALLLNGHEFGALRPRADRGAWWHEVPAGLVQDGPNVLSVVADDPADDILVGEIRLVPGDLRRVLALGTLEIRVRDGDVGDPLPCRLTITAADGTLPEVLFAARSRTAVRDGIAYTADGRAHVELPAGTYEVVATRGTEWSLARRTLRVEHDVVQHVALELRREVDTTGYVACDTHVHTLTWSGHGDASVEERLVTLAGEGVELAIATDHNHNTDYRPVQGAMGLRGRFLSVTGNEVTTDNGHFNAFPLDPADTVPDSHLPDWVDLVQEMRRKGAGVVILNHPRWPDDDSPFDRFHFTPFSGERDGGPVRFLFDGIEIANSDSLLDDPLSLVRDWFGVLNAGDRVSAVGSSDSHTVGVIVGQGRTYVRSSTDDPAALDLQEMVFSFKAGRTSVSLGIVADVTVQDNAGMGDLLPCPTGPAHVALRVAAPSWVRPRSAHVFVDGREVATAEVPATPGRPTETTLHFRVPIPSHDAYLACVVLGDGIDAPWWRTLKDYTFAATNPVYFDGDGDELWSSPRDIARRLLGPDGDLDEAGTRRCDGAVAVQMAAVIQREAPAAERAARLARLRALRPDDADLAAWFERHGGTP